MTSKKEPKKPEKKLQKESEKQEEIYLYDIIYCDEKRLAPMLPQLSNHGLLTDLSVTNYEGSKSGTSSSFRGAAAVVDGSRAKSAEDDVGISQQQNFDPRWVNVLKFAKQALQTAHREEFVLGKLCYVTGGLSLIDYASFEALLKIKFLHKSLTQGLKQGTEGTSKEKASTAKETMNLIEEVTSTYSTSVHGSINTKQGEFWISLDRDLLVFPAEDIILKYGSQIPGKWSVLGIYDSKPDDKMYDDEEDIDDEVSGSTGLTAIIRPIADEMRNLVGKPRDQHSITPLLIMREI